MAADINQLIDFLKKTSLDNTETTEKALNNLLVLARDNSSAAVFAHPECLTVIGENIDRGKSHASGSEIIVSCFRLLNELSRMSVERTRSILNDFPIDKLIDIIANSSDDNLMSAFQNLVQTILDTLAGVQETIEKARQQARLDRERTLTVAEAITTKVAKKVDEGRVKENYSILFDIIIRLIRRSASYIISASARDTLLALTMRNIDYQGLNFGVKLVEEDCVQTLLDIASEVEDIKGPSSMDITQMTHTLVAAVLEKMYSCHDHDKVRELFREKTQQYLNKRLHNPDMEDKVRAAKVFTVLLGGPTEIGNSCIGQTGMIEMILAMASSDEVPQQKAALDTIIAAASKKDKCAAIANLGEKILNQLRESKNEDIKIRALVGLSKVSSMGSTDASIRPFSRQANLLYARDCRAIISKPTPEYKLKQYAIEALAFLSFDGDVKEELVSDKEALEALFETLTFDMEAPVTYSILNIFVNLTNSYDKPEHSPELIELAKFAKQHIPEVHPKDKPEILKTRLEQLSLTELVPSLVQMANVKSKAAQDLLGRIMNALCEIEHIRGRLVQQGAVKLLLSLAQSQAPLHSQVDKSILTAAQGLARLGITINPEFVYPGQRMIRVVRPLKRLLRPECNALQNFEGLLALTNIAQASEPARAHLLNDNGFSLIEALMFEDHMMIRRAAVQCVVNIICDPQIVPLYEAENDRIKYLVLMCEEEDLETRKAASGALAMLCQVSEEACKRLKDWQMPETLSSDEDLIRRANVIRDCIEKHKNKFDSN